VRSSSLLIAAVVLLAPTVRAQTPADSALVRQIDPELAAHIYTTPVFDNHAHPILPPPNDKTDRDFDALPVDNMEPQTDPVAWGADNPNLPTAWKALWNIDLTVPLDADGMKRLVAARDAIKTRQGLNYDAYVLDRANIATMVANRVTMGPGLIDTGKPDTRFRWVPYNDALLFPFDNSGLAAQDPDKKLFFPLEDKVRARFLQALHLTSVPPTLDQYLTQVVTPTIDRERKGGAIAEKFEIAYLRSFDFTDPSRAEAARVYADLVGKSKPNPAEYKILQDFLFRYLAMEAGRLGMAVHIHVFSGAGSYFGIAGGNPMLLEPLFDDPRLRHTNFVMLHGGWPFVREANALLQKPNVYLDLSQQSLTFPPRTQATWLRELLETFPSKVLFGTDGFAVNNAMGWEESTWIAARNCRQSLALALTGMQADGEVTRTRAFAIADQVLSGNATQLYATKP
jgi:hypothetical protein